MHPVFFSVSSANIAFAEDIWKLFPPDWIYLYSRNGQHGVHMWDEIGLRELPKAQIIVISWSKNYPQSPGCVMEIKQASELYKLGMLKPIIIRIDDAPLHWKEGMDADTKPVFDALKPLLDFRSSNPGVSLEDARLLIARETEQLLQSSHPRMPRHDLVE